MMTKNFFCISADPEGPGFCAMVLTALAALLVVVTLPFSLCTCIKVVAEYERSVIFRLGRLRKGTYFARLGVAAAYAIPVNQWKIRKFTFTLVDKNFVKATFLLINTINLVSRSIFRCAKWQIYFHQKISRQTQINYLVGCFSETNTFTKYLQKV